MEDETSKYVDDGIELNVFDMDGQTNKKESLRVIRKKATFDKFRQLSRRRIIRSTDLHS